ncbi:MAG: GNAT family N-acetyltransferase [Lachnospiraceae bacterium]|nr:GNAT family N-acetyltransferase [Lachnospiraceae bacterium]
MVLKKYQKEHSAIICSWIKDEKSLYQWSANRIGKFPLADDDLNENYAPMMKGNRFIPLCAFDDNGNLVGHLYVRYPDENDDSIVRFGFVIVAPVLRGCGNGKKMLRLAIDYAKNTLNASKITLGVFTNNDSARYCYESVGFKPIGKTEIYKMSIGEWECIEMELNLEKD